MHDLLRLYSTHHGHANAESDERAQALNRLLDHYLTTARAVNAHLDGRAVADPAASGFTDRRQALAWLDSEFPNLTAATYAAGATDTSRALALLRSMQGFMLWRRHFDDMIAMCAAVRDAARRAGDRHDEAQVLCDLGIALCEARRFDEAITAGRDAARICHETGDRYGEARALIVVGSSAADLQLLDEAVTACRDAAQIFHLLGEPHAEGAALTQYGVALRKAGRFDEAISAHGRAAEIFREVGDRHRENFARESLDQARRSHHGPG
jgi:tetratricopeptide (TPR) repeat protein